MDLTISALNASNLTYDASDTEYGLYLKTITSPDGARTLGYDETGRYWQLFVNGAASSVGASDVHPAAGDTYVWYYSAFGDELPPATSSVKMSIIGRDADGRPESWVGEASHDVPTFSSAAALTESVLASSGLESDSGYGEWGFILNSITSPDGRELGYDKTTGRYWQLFVNGTASSVGASSVQLYEGDSVVWYYSAYGDSLPTSTACVTVIGRDALGNVETWLPETSRTVDFPTTADKLTVDILRDAGITADYGYGKFGFYLSSITSPFDPTWSPGYEEATGRYWQLFVNGKASDLGASSVQLGDGDSIVWYYSAYGDSIPTSDVPINPGAAHPEVSHDWAGFKGNDGTGVVERSTPKAAAGLAWQVGLKREGELFANTSDVLLVDGNVYQVVRDTLYVRDSATGAIKGSAPLAGAIGFVSRIQYADGLILVPLQGGSVQAITARGLETLWVSAQLPDVGGTLQQANSAVVVGDGCIYVNATVPGSFGSVACIDLASGHTRWRHDNEGAGYYWANMALSPAGLLSASEKGAVQLFNIASGLVLASRDLGAACRAGIVRDGDAYYVVTEDGVLHRLVLSGARLSETGSVHFCDYSTGTPTIKDGRAYVGGAVRNGSKSVGALATVDLASMTVISTVTTLESGEFLPAEVKSTPLVSVTGGETWVYFTCNTEPGAVYGVPTAGSAAREIFVPDADHANYCMSSVVCDAAGNLYYTNDSGTLFKIASGASPAPAPSEGGNTDGGNADDGNADNGSDNAGDDSVDDVDYDNSGSGSVAPRAASSNQGTKAADTAAAPATPAATTDAKKDGRGSESTSQTQDQAKAPSMPVWPFVGIGIGVVVLAGALVAMRKRG